MIKKFIIFNLIIGFIVASPLVIGCGDQKAKPKKASKAVSKKIANAKKAAPAKVTPPKSVEAKGAATTSAGSAVASPLVTLSTRGYNPEGRVNPFEPLFKEEPAITVSATTARKVRERRIPTTPLEKIDLSQLQLKAILRTAGGNKALVEESSGKGYIIKKGTYIGTRSGTVVAILKDRVIVEEESEDALGKVTIQERELKLQKPLGEE